MLPLLFLLPLGPLMKYGKNHLAQIVKILSGPFMASLFLALSLPYGLNYGFNFTVSLGLMVFFWILLGSLQYLSQNRPLSLRKVSMSLAHIGVGVTVLGIAISSAFSIEREWALKVQDRVKISRYEIEWRGLENISGPNYISYRAQFNVYAAGLKIAELHPEKRFFLMQEMPLSETAIDPGVWRDIYIALGEKLANGSWSVRIYYKPFVRWIWAGGILMALGGLLALMKRKVKNE